MSEQRTTRARDGALLHYSLSGSGPVVVALTHSLAMTEDFWNPVVAALGADTTVLRWDCRGHGRSDKPAGPYTIELFADDLAAVLDDAGCERVIAAGASMGGCVTLTFAIRHPARVSALGLFDTTASYGPSATADWDGRAAKAEADGLASMTDFQQTRWFGDAFRVAHPNVVQACVDTFQANDLAAYAETCRMLGRVALTEQLGTIAVPTTILVGEEDYATPLPMAAALHRGIAGSTLEVIPGARHLTPLEHPQLVAERLRALAGKVQS